MTSISLGYNDTLCDYWDTTPYYTDAEDSWSLVLTPIQIIVIAVFSSLVFLFLLYCLLKMICVGRIAPTTEVVN